MNNFDYRDLYAQVCSVNPKSTDFMDSLLVHGGMEQSRYSRYPTDIAKHYFSFLGQASNEPILLWHVMPVVYQPFPRAHHAAVVVHSLSAFGPSPPHLAVPISPATSPTRCPCRPCRPNETWRCLGRF